ncbi:Parathyroid hormone/parathyroid hormone-related peptide receptor [Nymphon striatum]|nr:Parathyroid hormone/parathyroid hormone-related peptide receptor [Nymphon striatum]
MCKDTDKRMEAFEMWLYRELCRVNWVYRQNVQCERCLPNWDGNICWTSTKLGETVRQHCPVFLQSSESDDYVHRKCLENGAWEIGEISNDSSVKTDYSVCRFQPLTHAKIAVLRQEPTLSIIVLIGYITSVATLVLASFPLAIMRRLADILAYPTIANYLTVKFPPTVAFTDATTGSERLRCPRNNLHLQLFASFIARGSLCILKEYIFVKGNMALKWTTYDTPYGFETWDCKLFIAFWKYSHMANYSWILMEGLYLHNLIFQTMFTDRSNISRYIILGWSKLLAIRECILALLDNAHFSKCWILYKHYPVFEWVTRGPTTLFILINFAFFVRIVRVLFIKLRGGDLQRLDGDSYRYRGKRYKKLIKSTLILVPLFGAYHIFLVILSIVSNLNHLLEIFWLYTDAICTPFQVALYSLRQDGRHSHMTFIATVCLRAEELGRYGFGRVVRICGSFTLLPSQLRGKNLSLFKLLLS